LGDEHTRDGQVDARGYTGGQDEKEREEKKQLQKMQTARETGAEEGIGRGEGRQAKGGSKNRKC
jgi:hypothetical protein